MASKLKQSRTRLALSSGRLKGATSRTEQQRQRQRYEENPWRKWYGTKEWKALRRVVAKRDNWMCQRTGVLLIGKHPKPNSLAVHHKKAHRGNWDLFIDPDNCEAVSKKWHDTEGQKEDRYS